MANVFVVVRDDNQFISVHATEELARKAAAVQLRGHSYSVQKWLVQEAPEKSSMDAESRAMHALIEEIDRRIHAGNISPQELAALHAKLNLTQIFAERFAGIEFH